MAYVALDTTDYLGAYSGSGLDSGRKARAEALADQWIDREFQAWDRSMWSGAGIPPDVQQAARLIAAAEYVLLEHAGTNPAGPGDGYSNVETWRETAEGIAGRAQSSGWLISPVGQKLYTREGAGASSRSGRLER